MTNESTLPHVPHDPLLTDAWLGTPEFPGYRANNVVARLEDHPQVDRDHLYFHLLLLDANSQLQDNHSGPCLALERQQSLPERIRFVRVVAELVRFSPNEDRGLSAIGQALTLVREAGVDRGCLLVAAQVLDNACSEEAVIASLSQLLKLSMGMHDARRAIFDVAAGLARRSDFDATGAADLGMPTADVCSKSAPPNDSSLHAQMSYIVHAVGKAHARRYLQGLMASELVPLPHMLGV
ncbi:MAG: hypothetical protein EOP82_06410 [Variovorax sp.]|nr:MAG: hypothetical protein EOP82_06410 [Variovorax sp.]